MKEFKIWIKEEAVSIKELRNNVKAQQRAKIDCWKDQWDLDTKSKTYRLYHIAYSMLRGKEYEQIERTVKDRNKLTSRQWVDIYKIQSEIKIEEKEIA